MLLPLCVFLLILYFRHVKILHKNWKSRSYLPPLSILRWKTTGRIISFLFLLVALSGPYFPGWVQSFPVKGRQIYFLLDVSASMNVKDLTPSRLAYSQRIIHRLINYYQGDEMGLIVFADDAYVQCPLTKDVSLLKTFLDMSDTRQFSRKGTQYRTALSTALDRFFHTQRSSNKGQRVVIILSDGGDHGDEYTSLIDRFNDANTSIIPIGVGTQKGDYIPDPTSNHPLKAVTDDKDRPVISKRKDQNLRLLARKSSSKYFIYNNTNIDIQPLVKQINQISLAILDDQNEYKPFNSYQIFLLFGIIVFIIEVFNLPSISREKDPVRIRH